MSDRTQLKDSPNAAKKLMDAITDGGLSAVDYEADDYMGATDCPDGCTVEPDGYCSHGYKSAGLSSGMI